MVSILEALCDGNLFLEPIIEKRSPEHKKASETAYSLMESLEKKLSAEEKELLDKATEAVNVESGYYATERFVCGYCLGALMMLEILEKRDELIIQREKEI